MNSTAADSLLGLELDGEWKVIEKIKPAPQSTGGFFLLAIWLKTTKIELPT